MRREIEPNQQPYSAVGDTVRLRRGGFPGFASCFASGFSCGLLRDCLVHVVPLPAAVRSYELLNQAWRLVILERREERKLQLIRGLWEREGRA